MLEWCCSVILVLQDWCQRTKNSRLAWDACKFRANLGLHCDTYLQWNLLTVDWGSWGALCAAGPWCCGCPCFSGCGKDGDFVTYCQGMETKVSYQWRIRMSAPCSGGKGAAKSKAACWCRCRAEDAGEETPQYPFTGTKALHSSGCLKDELQSVTDLSQHRNCSRPGHSCPVCWLFYPLVANSQRLHGSRVFWGPCLIWYWQHSYWPYTVTSCP